MIELYLRKASRFWRTLNRKIPPLGISLLLHLLLLIAVLLAGVSSFQKSPVKQSAPVIRAHAVDSKVLRVQEERKRREKEQAERKKREEREALKRKREKEKARKLKKKREKEQAKKEEKKRKAAEKKRREKQKRLKQKKEKKEAKKRAEKKKAEKQRAEKRKAEKRETEKKKAEEKRLRKQKQLQQQLLLEVEMELEQQLLSGEQQSRAENLELSQIRMVIRQQIERVWRKPKGRPTSQSCKVKVALLPDGGVGRVTIISGSGNQQFDLSVERAVYEAAPFPLPESVELRSQVRELEMTFVHEE